MKPTIVIDVNIPFIKGVLDNIAHVRYLNGSDINAKNVRDADALIIRTRTRCDEKLLNGSAVKYIATATIGFDHIDTEYCRLHNIGWTNAPGCNAASVQQYMASALCWLQLHGKLDLPTTTIGVVGVGHVGKLVAEFCQTIGMQVLLNDPPRERAEGRSDFVSLTEITEKCDVISFHTPLNRTGEDQTFHLADDAFLSSLQKNPVIINAARGEICDTEALKKAKKNNHISGIVLDCWEHEPAIDTELLSLCDIATPHIAGYSADGKANATTACVQYISRCFDLGMDNWQVTDIPQPAQPVITIKDNKDALSTAILHTYNIEKDSQSLKIDFLQFEYLRNNYPVRREFPFYTVQLKKPDNELNYLLKKIGFKTAK